MSKEICFVYGSYEKFHIPERQVTVYGDADMYLTSFFGGERGRCVQFTIQAGKNTAYAQLKRAEVQKVVDALSQWLEENK